ASGGTEFTTHGHHEGTDGRIPYQGRRQGLSAVTTNSHNTGQRVDAVQHLVVSVNKIRNGLANAGAILSNRQVDGFGMGQGLGALRFLERQSHALNGIGNRITGAAQVDSVNRQVRIAGIADDPSCTRIIRICRSWRKVLSRGRRSESES